MAGKNVRIKFLKDGHAFSEPLLVVLTYMALAELLCAALDATLPHAALGDPAIFLLAVWADLTNVENGLERLGQVRWFRQLLGRVLICGRACRQVVERAQEAVVDA